MDATGYKSVVGNVPRSCFMDTILFLEFCTVVAFILIYLCIKGELFDVFDTYTFLTSNYKVN